MDPIAYAIGRCNPEAPLEPGDDRWHDFDAVRGTRLHERISRRMVAAELQEGYSHIALAGHRGCGKSTELNRVAAKARADGYLALHAYVNDEADPNDVSFGDLFLLMLRLLVDAFEAEDLPRPDSAALQQVREWFLEVTKVEESEIERGMEAGAGVSAEVGAPWWSFVKVMGSLSTLLKSTNRRRREVRDAVERYPDELRRQFNRLLAEAQRAAASRYPRGFLFILDNLDRYTPEQIDEAVLKHAELYNGIDSHVIFVVPISLLYNPPGETLEDRFTKESLPMLPVFERTRCTEVNAAALGELVQAIHKRVNPALFAAGADLREIARLSGGCPRDLMRLLQEGLLETRSGQVDERAMRFAVNILRAEFARKLTYAHYAALARVHLDGAIDPDESGRFLLYRRAALEYVDVGGETWIGVHPLLWDTPELRAALEAERRRREDARPTA